MNPNVIGLPALSAVLNQEPTVAERLKPEQARLKNESTIVSQAEAPPVTVYVCEELKTVSLEVAWNVLKSTARLKLVECAKYETICKFISDAPIYVYKSLLKGPG